MMGMGGGIPHRQNIDTYKIIEETNFIYKINYKVKEARKNYGYIVEEKRKQFNWSDNGTYYEKDVMQYNLLINSELACKEWFDIYSLEPNGNCLIGYQRSSLEIEALKLYYRKHESEFFKIINYRWGAINSQGKYVIPAIYDKLSFNDEKFYIAYHNGNFGYIDSETGIQLTPIIYDLELSSNDKTKIKK